MTQLYDLLDKIREKPGMYLGYPSVSNLFMFLCGYNQSHEDLEIPLTKQEEEFQEFQPWLQKRFNLSTSASWARIILLYTTNEETGFSMFFELLEEFRQEQNKVSEVEGKLELPSAIATKL